MQNLKKQGIFKEFPVMKERLFNQKGDVTSTVINKIDFSDEKKGKKTIAKRESIMNEDGNITLKEGMIISNIYINFAVRVNLICCQCQNFSHQRLFSITTSISPAYIRRSSWSASG